MIYEATLTDSYAIFEEIPGKRFTDFAKVKEAIEELTDKICGKNKDIVDKAIILYVHSKNCPNLTVIDLPGLTRIAIEGQAADIYRVTTEMIRKYMSDPTSIILVVVPANQDITNDEVLHMARQVDSLGERTIGCITKIDIMDRGTDARELLLNKGEVQLKLGFVGIKNRSQEDINLKRTVVESISEEKMYFSKSPIYSSLPPACLGTNALITVLTKVLENNIIQFLPELMTQIKDRKAKLHQV
jgi:dynamin 1-like protein